MNQEAHALISATEKFVKSHCSADATGHDWFHANRVRNMALRIGRAEKADLLIIELAALLHDVDDWKLVGRSEVTASRRIRGFLESVAALSCETADHICEIIQTLSFKGAGMASPMRTIEGKIVQDADRLDALGAIGIARTFAYGGAQGRLLYDPAIPPTLHKNSDAYRNSTAPTLNHFYEKLFLLKDRMNTDPARKIAEEREGFMKEFVERFLDEWNFGGPCS